jgi:hypothetical protein
MSQARKLETPLSRDKRSSDEKKSLHCEHSFVGAHLTFSIDHDITRRKEGNEE